MSMHATQVRERNLAYEISDGIASHRRFSGMVIPKPSKRDGWPAKYQQDTSRAAFP
jgi:hypothetical protein